MSATSPLQRLSGANEMNVMVTAANVAVKSQAADLPADLVMLSDPTGARAEAIRALRTHIVAQHLDLGRRALVACSPHSEAGCSFVAANLAVSLAQVGIHTLLINADMRGPGLEALLEPQDENFGLRQALEAADRTPLDCIERDVRPHLSVLHSGGRSRDPLELLGDSRFEHLMTACLRDYDMTIIDTPPANAGADALRISTVVGYNLIIARQNQTRIADIKTLARELSADGARVVGTVLYGG